MLLARHDSHYTSLGRRGDRNKWRLWIEETSYARLSRNDFTPEVAFSPQPRPGVGLVLRRDLLGSCSVTARGKRGGVISYETRDLCDKLGSPDVRVRIYVGAIVITPLLRVHAVSRPATETWFIRGGTLKTGAGVAELMTARPLSLAQSAACIDVELDDQNIVYATEVIGNKRPRNVVARGPEMPMIVLRQFLRDSGYSETAEQGAFER